MRWIRATLLAGALGWLTGAAIATHHARSLPLPQTTPPRLFTQTTALERDEINPDTLRTLIGMSIDTLEASVEESEQAANWETLAVTISVAAFDAPEIGVRSGLAALRVSVRELA